MRNFITAFVVFSIWSISAILVYSSFSPKSSSIKSTPKSSQIINKTDQKAINITPVAAKDSVFTTKPINQIEKEIEIKNIVDFNYTLHTTFGSNNFRATKDFRHITDSISEILATNTELKVYIIGHTDDEGEVIDNEWIGMQRAKSVAKYMKRHGIDASKMVLESKGELEPIADNTTYTGKKQNRRIEIKIE